MRVKIPQPISAGVLLTYKCSAKCQHCMYSCSPQWPANFILENSLRDLFSRLQGKITCGPWGPSSISVNHGLHFTGGEPFLAYNLLLKATEIANDYYIPSIFVETNCSWCINDDTTYERLKALKQKGLKGILISVNPYYAEYVPFERTERCIHFSQSIFNENVIIYQYDYYQLFKTWGIKDKIQIKDYTDLVKTNNLQQHVELFLMGRAAYKLRNLYPSYPAVVFYNQPCIPPFLRNWHNHFDNYGNIMPGFCGGISLGKWQYLNELIDIGIELEKKPVLKYIIENDFQGLKEFAENYGFKESDSGYVSKCDLCLDIRKYLVTQELFAELNPIEFYQYL